MYSSGVEDENYLRGIAKTDSEGTAWFKTIFPGCYSGRWPHIHFEVYSSVAKAVANGPIVKTRRSRCRGRSAGRSTRRAAIRQPRQPRATSLSTDIVFSDDKAIHQLATVTGSVKQGLRREPHHRHLTTAHGQVALAACATWPARLARMSPFPDIEPHEQGMLDVGDGQHVYWEVCGNPHGKPAVVLHGGPGSGSSPDGRRLFDPGAIGSCSSTSAGCGRSTPHASEPDVDLSANTTPHLIGDCERSGRGSASTGGWCWAGRGAPPSGWPTRRRIRHGSARSSCSAWSARAGARSSGSRAMSGACFPGDGSGFATASHRNATATWRRHTAACCTTPTRRCGSGPRAWCDWEDTHVDIHGDPSPIRGTTIHCSAWPSRGW